MMNRKRSFSRYPALGMIFMFTLLVPMVAQCATYHVSLSGNDSNSGTVSKPFRTLKRAAQPLRPGDTLYIRAGVWTERLDLQAYNTSGTSSAYIKISGYPGEKPTIRYADPVAGGYGPIKARGTRGYLIFENFILDGINMPNRTGWQIPKENHHFILRNLEIKNFRFNGIFIEANNIQVINCTIHHQISVNGHKSGAGERWYGIYFHHGSNGLIQGNKIYSNPGGGIQAYPGPISNLVIRNNSIYQNNTLATSSIGGIVLYGGSSSSKVSSSKIYNNLVYKNGSTSTSGTASGILIAKYTTGTKVWNNTIYGNKYYGLHIGYDTTTSSTEIKNNISYSNGKGNYVNKGASTTYTNNLTSDPGFVNASAANFNLKSGSSAINKGVSLSAVPNDYRNYSRPRGSTHDIGGYEY